MAPAVDAIRRGRHRPGSACRPAWRTALAALAAAAALSTCTTTAEQGRDICGSLPAFGEHGLRGAWGLFAYPNDMSTATLQSEVTARCFAYGRTYDHRLNDRSGMHAPWFQRTFSVDGGACNVRGL